MYCISGFIIIMFLANGDIDFYEGTESITKEQCETKGMELFAGTNAKWRCVPIIDEDDNFAYRK